jgi:hypothetical protein
MAVALVCLSAQMRAVSSAQQAPPNDTPSIAGSWIGKVTADVGEMEISVSLTVKDGVASGSIETFHGGMTIAKGAFKDGKWTLPFSTPDGGTGKMIAVLKGDTLSGDWDFSPNAVGTFALNRRK